jgi:hypothetical protein
MRCRSACFCFSVKSEDEEVVIIGGILFCESKTYHKTDMASSFPSGPTPSFVLAFTEVHL